MSRTSGGHTKGPWSIVSYLDEHDRRGANVLVPHETKGARHRIHSANHCVAYTVPTLEDARLIAAAPEMLEALKTIASKTCVLGYDSGDSGVNAIALAAIKRAE